ncbi:MAG TPA: integrase arm-type DNA-binding domain-containing protein [Rhodanobacter sp.]
MLLSESAIRDINPVDKLRKLADGGGLYLFLNPNGSRWWRFRYRFDGKEKMLSMGVYPETTLEDARDKCTEARKLLAEGIDPSAQRKATKVARSPQVQSTIDSRSSGSLAALGIDNLEERTYRTLLTHPMATADALAGLLILPSKHVRQILDSIVTKGLATHSSEQPGSYVAAPPELAIEALAHQRQIGIEMARRSIVEMKEQALSVAESIKREQLVEVVTNRAAVGHIISHMIQNAQSEGINFQRLPTLFPEVEAPREIRPNVRRRSISDTEFLEYPGMLERVRLDVSNGEEARVFPNLPFKMFIVDRRMGIVPLNPEDHSGPSLLIHQCSLLDALYVLFELIWERSTPLLLTSNGQLETGSPSSPWSGATAQMMPLLAAGLNDKTIAYETGVSATTLSRRVLELMKFFGARTRFQLGWRAAMDMYSGNRNGNDEAPPSMQK